MHTLFVAALAIAAFHFDATQKADAPQKSADAPAPVLEWLKAHRTEGTALPTDLFGHDKDSARFVLVGRAFEGTHELEQLELTVWKASQGFDVIAVDVGFAEGEAADAWIHTGKGDVAAIAASFGSFGWNAADARAFLEALHAAPTKPIVAGIGVGEPSPILPAMLDYVRKAYPEGIPRAERILDGLRVPGRMGRPRYWFLDDNERGVLRYGIEEETSVLNDQKEMLVGRSNAVDYARAMRLLKVFAQYEQTMRFEREAGDEDPRGRILAENTLDAATKDGKSLRVLAFVNVRDLGRASDSTTYAAQLAKLAGVKPVCIGTACGSGSFLAYDPNDTGEGVRAPRKVDLPADGRTPLENAFDSAAKGAAVFDLRTVDKDAAVSAWFAERRNLRSARATCGGAIETPWDYAIAADFDALVWFPTISAAEVSATSSR